MKPYLEVCYSDKNGISRRAYGTDLDYVVINHQHDKAQLVVLKEHEIVVRFPVIAFIWARVTTSKKK